jgi:hypothetical protein
VLPSAELTGPSFGELVEAHGRNGDGDTNYHR